MPTSNDTMWHHGLPFFYGNFSHFCFRSLSCYSIAEAPVIEEPTTVLDCYDFPPAFKTHHLHDIFREYENMRGGYRIKWLEDTRALIIFEHPSTGRST